MPSPSEPPNRAQIADEMGNVTPVWSQWLTALRRALVPSDFFYIPSTSSAPTGTPEARTGFVPMVYDTAANKLYIYNGGWVSVTLS